MLAPVLRGIVSHSPASDCLLPPTFLTNDVCHVILEDERGREGYFDYSWEELGYKGIRLRELGPAARGSQEAGFTQPRDHLIGNLCRYNFN